LLKFDRIPESSYGILRQDHFESEIEEIAEQVSRLGYATLDSGYTNQELQEISKEFDLVRDQYLNTWGESNLKSINEFHTIRALLTQGSGIFLQLAMNANLLAVLEKLIVGTFILNQQNGIINPPSESYNQGSWHRDLPYQHFISSSPLAVNALFCLDDFNSDNGSTFVLPASHKAIAFPSDTYIQKNAVQVEAKAGQFILLDCMLFHSGGFNKTTKNRRGVNHVYNIPYFKQQINLIGNMPVDQLTKEAKAILGFNLQEPSSIEDYLASRSRKIAG